MKSSAPDMNHTDALREVRESLGENRVLRCAPVGSTYILGYGADLDVLVLVNHVRNDANFLIDHKSFESDCSAIYEGADFISVRKGDINAILTQDSGFFSRFLEAAEVCRFLKVSDKAQRIAVHDFIRDCIPFEGGMDFGN